jgi:hypothetical protein
MSKIEKIKIIQILPAPPGMSAVYHDDEGGIFQSPVLCLALVEQETIRWVQPLTFDGENGVDSEGIYGKDVNLMGYHLIGEGSSSLRGYTEKAQALYLKKNPPKQE